MSVLEDLRSIEERLTGRIRELEPAVEEYNELVEAAKRLGLDVTPQDAGRKVNRRTPAAAAATSPAPRRKAAAATGRRRGRRGARGSKVSRRDQVLDAVMRQPGVTVTALGKEFGVDPTSLYRVVRKLEGEGLVTKQGAELRPATPAQG